MKQLRLPALRIQQSATRAFYAFAIDAKTIPAIAAVSRVKRGEDLSLRGYQRPQVLAHIAAIREYIESDDPMLPNGLLIAFDGRVRFRRNGSSATEGSPFVQSGILTIPLVGADEPRPGWIVDGQQRIAAIASSRIESLPVLVSAFITESVEEQRGQFILVNASKPLPKGLVTELLPGTDTLLPRQLRRRRVPAQLLDRLNADKNSPFRGRIQTPTAPDGVIKDNSVIRMLEHSLSDGSLYAHRKKAGADVERMLDLVKAYWWAVAAVFPDAWKEAPRRSRLTHGVGIVSMGFLMDTVVADSPRSGRPTFERVLGQIAPECAWTGGAWKLKPHRIERRWNDLQNTPPDIALLTDHLTLAYRSLASRNSRGSTAVRKRR